MFYGGKLKAMPAKLMSDNGEHVVIRPLAFCKEEELAQYANLKNFPIIPCNLCGSQPNLERQNIKAMLKQWQQQHPGRLESMFTATRNIAPSHLCDSNLFDFKSVSAESEVINGGDIAFDAEPIKQHTEIHKGIEQANMLDIVEIK